MGNAATKTKLLCGWQLWSKAHYDDHKETFETEFTATGLVAGTHKAPERVKFTKRKYTALPDEERAKWEQQAADLKANKPSTKKEKNAKPVVLEPAAAQE